MWEGSCVADGEDEEDDDDEVDGDDDGEGAVLHSPVRVVCGGPPPSPQGGAPA